MNYKETLQTVDTAKALSLIGLEYEAQGAYFRFKCLNHKCDSKSVIKAYGDKKNLYYCPKCKLSGHIISLVMAVKGLDWEGAKDLLSKAQNSAAKKIETPLDFNYELAYNAYFKLKGISEETCKQLEIGVPKGKTMLAQCATFAVHDETGKKIAYYDIKMKDGKPVFHKSFNPELYLYNFHRINQEGHVYFSDNIFDCVKYIQLGSPAICNFGLPYLSPAHIELLKKVARISFAISDQSVKTFAVQMAENKMNYYNFLH